MTHDPTPPTAESPCIKVCTLDLDQRCRGCGRTVDEIRLWRDMTTAQRIAVNQRLGFVSHERPHPKSRDRIVRPIPPAAANG
ncbi:MAG: DUF1289 domain-containing protein [Gemmatimonadaceae bacterium]|jgi:hypothetical protein